MIPPFTNAKPRYRIETHVLPVAEPRKRMRVVKTDGRSFVKAYTPTKDPVNAFKATVRHAFSKMCSGPPLDGPLGVRILYVFPRPQSLIWSRRPMPRRWREAKPDLDNLEKAVLDALNEVAWRDDKLIAWKLTAKVTASGVESPQVRIEIFSLPDYESLEDGE